MANIAGIVVITACELGFCITNSKAIYTICVRWYNCGRHKRYTGTLKAYTQAPRELENTK